MYKVFIYDKPVYLTSDDYFEVKNCQQFYAVDVNKIIEAAEMEENEGVVVYCENLALSFDSFLKPFEHIVAAGGVVENDKKEWLFIHRLGKWDLPKGKLELNEHIKECAVREVEEECNVTQLEVMGQLADTYHCYPYRGRWAFKTTHWYKMKSTVTQQLMPQTEEGIDQVIWLSKNDLSLVLKNTYSSIKELLKTLL